MSANLFPMPVGTPLISKQIPDQMTEPWLRYMKSIGDELLQADILSNGSVYVAGAKVTTGKLATAFKYSINSNLMLCIYYKETAETVDVSLGLPFPTLAAFQCLDTVYAPGTKTVIIPANTAFAQFWALADLRDQASN